jgi:hypothetical protein
VVTAAKKHKTRGLGVDLDPRRVRDSNQNAQKAGATDLVEFRNGNALLTDVSKANVVTLFLLERINVLLRPRLFAQLKPGSRVVSNSFSMRDWKPDKEVRHKKAYSNVIYLWTIPAGVGGTWTWRSKVGGKEIAGTAALKQEFQAVRGTVGLAGAAQTPLAKPSLCGKELRFSASVGTGDKAAAVTFCGKVDGDAITGTQEWRGGPHAGTHPWTAKRKPVDLAGRWQVRAPSHSQCNGTLRIRRTGADLKAVYVRDDEADKELPLPALYVWGSSIRFEVPWGNSPLAFAGSLGPDAGGGTVGREQSQRRSEWSAKRLAGE